MVGRRSNTIASVMLGRSRAYQSVSTPTSRMPQSASVVPQRITKRKKPSSSFFEADLRFAESVFFLALAMRQAFTITLDEHQAAFVRQINGNSANTGPVQGSIRSLAGCLHKCRPDS